MRATPRALPARPKRRPSKRAKRSSMPSSPCPPKARCADQARHGGGRHLAGARTPASTARRPPGWRPAVGPLASPPPSACASSPSAPLKRNTTPSSPPCGFAMSAKPRRPARPGGPLERPRRPAPRVEAAMDARFHGKSAAKPQTLPDTLLNLEVGLSLDSPPEFEAARRQFKMNALKFAMENRRPSATTPADIERWLPKPLPRRARRAVARAPRENHRRRPDARSTCVDSRWRRPDPGSHAETYKWVDEKVSSTTPAIRRPLGDEDSAELPTASPPTPPTRACSARPLTVPRPTN